MNQLNALSNRVEYYENYGTLALTIGWNFHERKQRRAAPHKPSEAAVTQPGLPVTGFTKRTALPYAMRRAADYCPDISIAAAEFRGGTQAIDFDGGWLALVHEVLGGASEKQRVYHHRFVWFDAASTLQRVSRPFFFRKKGIEFAAGLAWHPDGKRLLISYGVDDGEAWIATVVASEVLAVLDATDGVRPKIDR
jgi:hypothetical protein